ncbi:MAG: tRNA (adenosine(37)-N6)-threonylcarbamoyltransferase complex transferase subunit TsaD [Bryocella sp.]
MSPSDTKLLILGIESSCDETSASVVRGGTEVLSNVVASQLVHADYGGVVPELASREHLRAITPVVREAMHQAGVTYADLAAVAVTEGPGLAGALLVGITFAKSLAFAAEKPLIAVNHLEGHIHAVLMEQASKLASQRDGEKQVLRSAQNDRLAQDDKDKNPLLALVVSGGHTHLYLAAQREGVWTYRNVGKTLDDAAGEAFDKVAKLLGLPYPGGPWMDALAKHGDAKAVPFSFARIKTKVTRKTAPKLAREAKTDDVRFDLSFSGIKTAVRRYVEVHGLQEAVAARAEHLRVQGLLKEKPSDADAFAKVLASFDVETLGLIASFQSSVTQYLTRMAMAAAEHYGARGLLVTGGVAANSELRVRLQAAAKEAGLPIAFPTIALSTDNAAMIAAAAYPKLVAGSFAESSLEPTPQLRLG